MFAVPRVSGSSCHDVLSFDPIVETTGADIVCLMLVSNRKAINTTMIVCSIKRCYSHFNVVKDKWDRGEESGAGKPRLQSILFSGQAASHSGRSSNLQLLSHYA